MPLMNGTLKYEMPSLPARSLWTIGKHKECIQMEIEWEEKESVII